MDIFNKIVYPQSAEHLILLKYLLFLTLLVLLPYLSVLLGSTIFSVTNIITGNKNKLKNKFAKDLIDIFTPNKVMAISLGIVPFISIILCLEQLLFGVSSHITSGLIISLSTFVIGVITLYLYKYSFGRNETTIENEINYNPSIILGVLAIVFILFSTYLLLGILQFIIDTRLWNAEGVLINVLFSSTTFLYFLFFISISFVSTSTVILYKHFKNSKGANNDLTEYSAFIKNFSLKTGLLFAFMQPLLFVLVFISYPDNSLSFIYFIVGTVVLLLMLLLSILFYDMKRSENINLSGQSVFVILLLFSLIIAKDIFAFDTSTKVHFLKLDHSYLLHKKELLKKYESAEKATVSGESIFNNKCSACHRFDTRLVGPAYNKVLPKYEGKENELIDFILHPRKINPKLPIMPAQGLKPKEAEAIAKYIMSKYKK